MGDRTGIEWTDATWNPIRGCSRVSEGCRNCYAERVASRFSGPGEPYHGLAFRGYGKGVQGGPRWTGEVRLVAEHLADPLRWRRPRRVFVNSMSDLFHEKVPDEWIDRIFAAMALGLRDVERCRRRDCSHDPCEGDGSGRFSRHTFQILTKRPERARVYLSHTQRQDKIGEALSEIPGFTFSDSVYENVADEWPLPNVWLGVSVEDQATADARIPLLLSTPAAVRFVSYEPALGPVDFGPWIATHDCRSGQGPCWRGFSEELGADDEREQRCPRCGGAQVGLLEQDEARLNWVIVGGESGPGARPFDVAWARSTIAACRAAGVACFVKQLGARPFVGEPVQVDVLKAHEDVALVTTDGHLGDRKGGDPYEWPEDLRVRAFPAQAETGAAR